MTDLVRPPPRGHRHLPVHRPGGQHPPPGGAPRRSYRDAVAPPPLTCSETPSRRRGRGVRDGGGTRCTPPFASPADAVAGAPWPGRWPCGGRPGAPPGQFRAAMGLHLGEVEAYPIRGAAQGARYFGLPLVPLRPARWPPPTGGRWCSRRPMAERVPRRPAGGGGPARPGCPPPQGPASARRGWPVCCTPSCRPRPRPCAEQYGTGRRQGKKKKKKKKNCRPRRLQPCAAAPGQVHLGARLRERAHGAADHPAAAVDHCRLALEHRPVLRRWWNPRPSMESGPGDRSHRWRSRAPPRRGTRSSPR